MIWSLMSRFGTLGFALISNIILARLLTPSDFGCIGMLMVFVALANTFIDSGLGAALIQKRLPTETDYSTVFTFNIVLSITLYIILFFSSPYIADFYHTPILSKILKVQGIILLINGLRIVQYNILIKKMQFKVLALYEILATILGCCTGIIMAYCECGVWSIVLNNIIYSLIFTALLYLRGNDYKIAFVFDYASFKSLFSFGGLILLSNLIDSAYKNIHSLVIGRAFNTTQLGYYSQAEKLESIPVVGISQSINGVFFPIFSQIQDDKEKLREVLCRSIKTLTYLSFPIMTLLILVASPLINFVYSDKWQNSIPMFQMLCIAGMIIPVNMLNLNIIRSLGKGKKYLIMQIIQFCSGLFAILFGLNWGIKGLLIGSIVASYLYFVCICFINSSLLRLSIFRQIHNISSNFLLTIISGGVVYFCINQIGSIGIIADIIIPSIIFTIIYVFLSYIVKAQGFTTIKSLIIDSRK